MTSASENLPQRCARCGKLTTICVCERIVAMETTLRVLVLQHPREQDIDLGSAKLVALSLPRAKLVVGLSWRSLEHAWGEAVDVSRWGVLYPMAAGKSVAPACGVYVIDRHGKERGVAGLQGVVVLDGSWSQAKTLWWRNPWLLKLSRLIVHPAEPSIYGRLRPEPRRGYVSTLEAVAQVLQICGAPEGAAQHLRVLFRTMVQRARDAGLARHAPRPAKTRRRRASLQE